MSKVALKPPDPETLDAIQNIADTRDWAVVKVWLQRETETAVQASFNPDVAACRQAQGRAMFGQMLLELFQKASSRSQG